jgi:MerR family transcriptional regulator, light-induced transcriptional regulator
MTRTANDQAASDRQWRYTQTLLSGDDQAAFQILQEMVLEGCQLGDIFLNLITPALVNVGQLWCDGRIGVGLEKLASHLVLKHMDRLRDMYSSDGQRLVQRILVSCVEGEQHCIGARMVADLFLIKGWSVDFLGADVPTTALLDTIKLRRPQLVALSVRTATGLEHANRVLAELGIDGPKILLGGQAFLGNEWPKAGTSAVAHNVVEGVEIASKLLNVQRPKAVLKEYLVSLGRRVRDLRNKKGWTQEQLAESTRLTRVSIVGVEGGKQNISMDVVIRLANSLGTSPEDLLSDSSIFGA